MTDARRALPSVGALLELARTHASLAEVPHPALRDAARRAVEEARLNPTTAPAGTDGWLNAVSAALAAAERRSLRPLLNGTGVLLHTNLGRAPLAEEAIAAITGVAGGYANVEYDVAEGGRGSRYDHCAALLRELTGAEDALVVNNNAAALIVALNTLADSRGCLVSRGELVEIGGGFRVPEIMGRSGALLIEIGTTNRTTIDDYRRAIDSGVAAIAKVHRSNFRMTGFVADVAASDLAALGRERGLSVIHDLGSGLLLPLDDFGLTGEPTASEAVQAGATVVTMSGDKLLGGPQAGILLGARAVIAAIRANPLTRALRVDKLTLAALEATLALYRDPERAIRAIPVLAQLSATIEQLGDRARALRDAIAHPAVAIVDSEASVGGGAYPGDVLPSMALAIDGDAAALEARLRTGSPGVVTRVHGGRVLIDLRSLLPRDDAILPELIRSALGAAAVTVPAGEGAVGSRRAPLAPR